jgi:hypothetical protein
MFKVHIVYNWKMSQYLAVLFLVFLLFFFTKLQVDRLSE